MKERPRKCVCVYEARDVIGGHAQKPSLHLTHTNTTTSLTHIMCVANKTHTMHPTHINTGHVCGANGTQKQQCGTEDKTVSSCSTQAGQVSVMRMLLKSSASDPHIHICPHRLFVTNYTK